MEITFNNLKPETLKALLGDPGLPQELRTPIGNLVAQAEKGGDAINASHDADSFVNFCSETAAQMRSGGEKVPAIAASFGASDPANSFIALCEETAIAMA